MADVGLLFSASLPYLIMTLCQLSLAFLLLFLQSLLTDGVNATVLVVYEQIISATFLSCSALFFDKGKRPPLSFPVLAWAFVIGFLQIPLGELMATASLRYITPTFQSVALNTIPTVVFVLATFTGQESFRLRSWNGFAKVLGILTSTADGEFEVDFLQQILHATVVAAIFSARATVLVFISDPTLSDSGSTSAGERWIGRGLVGIAVLGLSTSNLLVERLALKYQADLTLSAIMGLFGTLQTLIIAASIERNPSSWCIRWNNSLLILTILYAGIVTGGLGYFARNWCVRVKGPVFASAFSPLLIVCSFLLQTIFLGASAQPWSIAAALLVIGSLYLLLWAKSKDNAKDEQKHSPEILIREPLMVSRTA